MTTTTGATAKQRLRFLMAEFVVIVVGVLVALGVDQLMSERDDRVAEREYALRLQSDLASDTVMFSWFRDVLTVKADVLQSLLLDPASFAVVSDAARKMSSLTYSTFIGLPPINSSTFQELQSSGHLALIVDPVLRSRLTVHYSRYDRMTAILDEVFGSYREIVFSSLPGALQYAARADSLAVDVGLLRSGLETLVRDPHVDTAANAELGYTASMLFYLNEADARARELLLTLESIYSR